MAETKLLGRVTGEAFEELYTTTSPVRGSIWFSPPESVPAQTTPFESLNRERIESSLKLQRPRPAIKRRAALLNPDLAENPTERMRNQASFRKVLGFVHELHAAGEIDIEKLQEFETVRVEHAPAPEVPPSAPLLPNCVMSVVLGAGESVEWTWTTDTSGARYVTGYTIVGPRRTARARPASQ